MSLPHIFIASSTRSLPRANALAKSLSDIADILVWKNPDAFPPGAETLTPLLEHAYTTDFAIFLFTKDDEVKAHDGVDLPLVIKPRDNVLFEFGLFYGALGRDRVFTIMEQGLTMPTDLKAMTVNKTFTAFPSLNEENCLVELKEASVAIRTRLQQLFSNQVHSFDREASVKLRKTLRKLHSLAFSKVLTTGEKFRIELADRLVEEAFTELHQALGGGSYVSELTLEKSFLNRAAHIFGHANLVLATSLDRYSKFWLPQDEPGKKLVQRYIEIQPPFTYRLFVFTHPRSAAFHREVLSKQHETYGISGGIFLCSLNSYSKLIKAIPNIEQSSRSNIEQSTRFLTEDFAFLEYKNDRQQINRYLARLSQNTLQFDPVVERDQVAMDVRKALEGIIEMQPHEFNQETKILRWGDAYRGDDGRWCDALEKLFQPSPPEAGTEDADILHLVFFRRSSKEREKELVRAIANARLRLALTYSTQRNQVLIRDIWFGRNTKTLQDLAATDELTGAEVRPHQTVTQRYPFCLMVRVDGQSAYKEYLANKTHHEVRREIQATFGDININRLLEKILAFADPADQKIIFEELEHRSQRFMVRAAYMRDEDLRSLVELELKLRNQPALRRALQF